MVLCNAPSLNFRLHGTSLHKLPANDTKAELDSCNDVYSQRIKCQASEQKFLFHLISLGRSDHQDQRYDCSVVGTFDSGR